MKRLSESSVRGWRTARKKGAIKKRKIDYSDIPSLSDKQLASMRRVGRPPLGEKPRQLIAIRLDTSVLRWLKISRCQAARALSVTHKRSAGW